MASYGEVDACRIGLDGSSMGMKTIVLENRHIKVVIIPEYGGKIAEIVYKPHGFNFLWENRRLKGRKAYYGANYDNFQNGGIEDAFPTILPSQHQGEEIPFFGEVWSVPWEYAVFSDGSQLASVKLECYCAIYPVKIEKIISLKIDSFSVTVQHRIINESELELDYLFGVHPSFEINGHCMLDIPDSVYTVNWMQPETWRGYSLGTDDATFQWPRLKGIDLSRLLGPEENAVVHFYRDQIAEGRVRIFDPSQNIGFRMEYDPEFFKVLSVWLIYGGWRGHYCLMIEPFTSWPLTLDKAVEMNKAMKLKPRQVTETEVIYSVEKPDVQK